MIKTDDTNGQRSSIYFPQSDEDKAQFELANREATALSRSTWTPKHLIGRSEQETIATCIGLVTMAKKWKMSAQMVAGETYSVHGKIGFQGKLYSALANAHGGLVGGLRIIYSGKGDGLAGVVFGADHELTDDDKANLKKLVKDGCSDAATDLELNNVKAIRVLVSQCKTDQAMWKNDPEQKLFYTGSTKWCRKFMPDLVLGAISVEDQERIEYVESGLADENPVDRFPVAPAVVEEAKKRVAERAAKNAKNLPLKTEATAATEAIAYPLPATECPSNPSPPFADYWKKMSALTEDQPLRALSDKVNDEKALDDGEKQLLWDEIKRRIGG